MDAGLPLLALAPATGGDLAWVAALHRAAMYDQVARTVGWDDEVQADRLRRHFDPAAALLIEVDGERVGCVSVSDREEELFVRHFYLAPAWQGKGIGTRVLRRIARHADQLGRPIRLTVLHGSRAVSLYLRNGYQVVEEGRHEVTLRRPPAERVPP